MKVALNYSTIGALAVPASGQTDYWDTRQTGLGIRVSMAGTRTWTLMYRHGGQLRRAVLGHWPSMGLTEARKAARKIRSQSDAGEDPAAGADGEAGDGPQAAAAPAIMTVADLAGFYLDHHARINKRPRTVAADIRMFNSAILPRLGDRAIGDVTRSDIRLLLHAIVARGAAVYANRVRALLGVMFSIAVDHELVDHNVVKDVKRPLRREPSREKVLSDDELRRLWLALDDAPLLARGMFRLLLLTATRKTETLAMSWAELDLDIATWNLPGQRTKNGLPHRIPLTPLAVATLRELQDASAGGPFVFPGVRGRPLYEPKALVGNVYRRAGLTECRLHDIRRTVASNLAGLGVPRLIISKILNHSDRTVTAVYDRHSYGGEMRSALLKWERELMRIVSGDRRGQVIELPRAS